LRAVAPFEAFDTTTLFRGKVRRGLFRVITAVVIVDVFPVFLLYKFSQLPLISVNGARGIAAAATLSMSLFSVHRLLHAFIFTRPFLRCFYSDDDAKKVEDKGGKSVDGIWEHLIPAIVYLVLPFLVAHVIAGCWPW